MTNNELYTCAKKAQFGDREAMRKIIDAYYPLIKKTSKSLSPQSSKDFEQSTIEKIVRAVYNYDLNLIPDFKTFLNSFDNIE